MKIEAGKYYVTRGGDVVGPLRHPKIAGDHEWVCPSQYGAIIVYKNGKYRKNGIDHPNDLIKEHVMPKFKVGDRVRRGGDKGNIVKFFPYEYATIAMDDGRRFDAPVDQLQDIPSEPPLDLTKPVQTRDGRKVRLLCTDGPGEYPVIGIIECDHDGVCRWPLNGRVTMNVDMSIDLVNTPAAPRTFERWFNVYASEDTPTVILTLPRMNRKDADAMSLLSEQHGTDSNFRRIARKRVVFTEGEWDE